jgi:uncharacterized membrane protein
MITLTPNLFASKAGQYYIIGLTVLMIVAIIIQLIYNPKTILFSLLIGVFFYLRIIGQRKKDIEQYEKMK